MTDDRVPVCMARPRAKISPRHGEDRGAAEEESLRISQ